MFYIAGQRFDPSVSPFRRLDIRPAHTVLGYSPEQLAEIECRQQEQAAQHALRNAEAALLWAREGYLRAKKAIGEANQGIRGGLLYRHATKAEKRGFRSIAFRNFNASLKALRAAEKAFAAAQASAGVLAH